MNKYAAFISKASYKAGYKQGWRDSMTWVEVPPQREGGCSYPGCEKSAVWTRKPGWIVAPGSPPGDVCEEHHCWERLEGAVS